MGNFVLFVNISNIYFYVFTKIKIPSVPKGKTCFLNSKDGTFKGIHLLLSPSGVKILPSCYYFEILGIKTDLEE